MTVSPTSTTDNFSPQHNSSTTSGDSGIEQDNAQVISELKENLAKSTNQSKDLEETISAKDRTIQDLKLKLRASLTETLNAKKDVKTKNKIILSLNSQIKNIEEEKLKM